MEEEELHISCGGIGNYYGGLELKKDDDKYYWGIENYNGISWQEIPQSLYEEIDKFESEDK